MWGGPKEADDYDLFALCLCRIAGLRMSFGSMRFWINKGLPIWGFGFAEYARALSLHAFVSFVVLGT